VSIKIVGVDSGEQA